MVLRPRDDEDDRRDTVVRQLYVRIDVGIAGAGNGAVVMFTVEIFLPFFSLISHPKEIATLILAAAGRPA